MVVKQFRFKAGLVCVEPLRQIGWVGRAEDVEASALDAAIVRDIAEDVRPKLVVEREPPCRLLDRQRRRSVRHRHHRATVLVEDGLPDQFTLLVGIAAADGELGAVEDLVACLRERGDRFGFLAPVSQGAGVCRRCRTGGTIKCREKIAEYWLIIVGIVEIEPADRPFERAVAH